MLIVLCLCIYCVYLRLPKSRIFTRCWVSYQVSFQVSPLYASVRSVASIFSFINCKMYLWCLFLNWMTFYWCLLLCLRLLIFVIVFNSLSDIAFIDKYLLNFLFCSWLINCLCRGLMVRIFVLLTSLTLTKCSNLVTHNAKLCKYMYLCYQGRRDPKSFPTILSRWLLALNVYLNSNSPQT